MKMSIFRHIVIISGTGVGGGSLVYANTLPVPKTSFYKSGSWSELEDWENELKPFYQKALTMLGASRNPKLFDGDLALKELAKEIDGGGGGQAFYAIAGGKNLNGLSAVIEKAKQMINN